MVYTLRAERAYELIRKVEADRHRLEGYGAPPRRLFRLSDLPLDCADAAPSEEQLGDGFAVLEIRLARRVPVWMRRILRAGPAGGAGGLRLQRR